MNVMRWGVSAVAALLLAGGSSFAGNSDELNSMKATMDNMKQEMDAMRASMASEREAMRANAGGAPEALKSANGKATVKIGGDFKILYDLSWESGYNPTDGNDLSRYTRSAWDIYKAQLKFTIDFTPDTQAFVGLRPDRGSAAVGQLLDEIWWKWSNIGGTAFSLKVGLQTLDYGMYNGEKSPWDRVMIWDPYTKNSTQTNVFDASREAVNGSYHQADIGAIGASLAYKFDQVKLVAGIFGQQINGAADQNGQEADAGVTTDGTPRNLGFENHYFTAYYDPCWLEKLHLQASYMGQFDNGEGTANTYFTNGAAYAYRGGYNAASTRADADADPRRGATYIPSFDAGFSYIQDCWAIYGEGVVTVNPNYYRDSTSFAFSTGADYSLTEKLKIGGALEWKSAYINNDSQTLGTGASVNQWGMRAALGTRYDFGNGLYVKAQYSHSWLNTYGFSSATNNYSDTRDCDQMTLMTGCVF